VDIHSVCHQEFFEDKDLPQGLYEKARKATTDQRVGIDENLRNTLNTHGVAGLFIEPEQIVVSSTTSKVTRRNCRNATALYNANLSDQSFATISKSLAEGVGIRSTTRIQGVNKKTVLLVLRKAAFHVAKVSQNLLKNLNVSECQLDEMWSFIAKKEKNLTDVERMVGILGDAWIWIAFDAVTKIFVATVIGKRTTAFAVKLLEEVERVTCHIPDLFSSDQLDQYPEALLQVYGLRYCPPRKPGPGRPPQPRLVPPHALNYVQVVKRYKQNRVIKVDRKVVFGDPVVIEQILQESPVSQRINTSYVERANGTVRHVDARCNRKTYRFSKLRENHQRQFDLSMGYYHLCKPHKSLSNREGKSTTPFMAAGITDHVWTMTEILTYPIEN